MEPASEIGRLLNYCDVLLIEADGSKGLPVKVPAEHEPVIIPETQVVIGCAGLTAIGEMIQEVCFRSEFLERIRKDGKVTEQLLAEILCSESGTRKECRKKGVSNSIEPAGRKPGKRCGRANGQMDRPVESKEW